MDITGAKVITAILLFILTMLFSLIPYFIVVRGSRSAESVRRREWFLSHLNCFAGGVFLATFLCHILAEGGEEFDDYLEKAEIDMDFPLFNVFVATGFFLVAFVELVAQNLMAKNTENIQHPIKPGTDGDKAPLYQGNRPIGYGSAGGSSSEFESETQEIEHAHSHGHAHVPKPAGLRAFLLLIALSFHTIFDGLAVGLQVDEPEVWAVFAAICVHKSVISFCIGLEIWQSSRDKWVQALLWLSIFAIMSPVGIGVGIGLTSGSGNELARLLASSVLQGLAGGTFMYVTFLEILCLHIGHHGQGNFFHIFWALVGFGLMAATKLFDKD